MNTNNLLKEAFKLKKNKDYKKAEFRGFEHRKFKRIYFRASRGD